MTLDILYQRWFTPKLRFQILVNLIVYPVSISFKHHKNIVSDPHCGIEFLFTKLFQNEEVSALLCISILYNYYAPDIPYMCTVHVIQICMRVANNYSLCKPKKSYRCILNVIQEYMKSIIYS